MLPVIFLDTRYFVFCCMDSKFVISVIIVEYLSVCPLTCNRLYVHMVVIVTSCIIAYPV